MSIQFVELEREHARMVRVHMVNEVFRDTAAGGPYGSCRLNFVGLQAWPMLLLEAVRNYDDAWLERQLIARGLLLTHRNGRRVPVNAAQMLAEGEFNRMYCRAVCLLAIELGELVRVYRGKRVQEPRRQSQTLIGQTLDPRPVLETLRATVSEDLRQGVPAGPNSGITIEIARS